MQDDRRAGDVGRALGVLGSAPSSAEGNKSRRGRRPRTSPRRCASSRLHTGSKCKASKEKITKGEIRLCARVGTFAQLEANDEREGKMFYNPMAIRPFWKVFTRRRACTRPRSRARSCSTSAHHRALLDANEDERARSGLPETHRAVPSYQKSSKAQQCF